MAPFVVYYTCTHTKFSQSLRHVFFFLGIWHVNQKENVNIDCMHG